MSIFEIMIVLKQPPRVKGNLYRNEWNFVRKVIQLRIKNSWVTVDVISNPLPDSNMTIELNEG